VVSGGKSAQVEVNEGRLEGPAAWSIALAAPAGALPDPYLLFLFGSGSFLAGASTR